MYVVVVYAVGLCYVLLCCGLWCLEWCVMVCCVVLCLGVMWCVCILLWYCIVNMCVE